MSPQVDSAHSQGSPKWMTFFERPQRAIQPVGLVASQFDLAVEAACVQHCAVANLEMHRMGNFTDSSRFSFSS